MACLPEHTKTSVSVQARASNASLPTTYRLQKPLKLRGADENTASPISCSSPNQRRENSVLGGARDSGAVPFASLDVTFSELLLPRDLIGLEALDSSTEFAEEDATERVRARTSKRGTTVSGLEITWYSLLMQIKDNEPVRRMGETR